MYRIILPSNESIYCVDYHMNTRDTLPTLMYFATEEDSEDDVPTGEIINPTNIIIQMC